MASSFAKRRYARGLVASAALAVVALAVASERSCAEPNKQIIERAQHYKGDVLKLWERLVSIDSGTGDEQGLKEVGAIATEELRKLGAAIEIFPAKPAVGDNVVASFDGTGRGGFFSSPTWTRYSRRERQRRDRSESRMAVPTVRACRITKAA